MRKIFVLALILIGLQVNAQERKNDVMISPLDMVIFPSLNISYERALNKDAGVGINVLKSVGRTFLEEDKDFFQVSPYYRMYFGKKYALGFFVEAFLPITYKKEFLGYTAYDNTTSTTYFYERETKETSFGFGFGAGAKWLTKRNIVIEISGGLGRQLTGDEEMTGKGMFGIGYRF